MELHNNILNHAERLPLLQTHQSYRATSIGHQQTIRLYRQFFLTPAVCQLTHQSALSQLEIFQIPGEPLASDPQVLLTG